MSWWRDIAYGVGAAASSPVWGYALWKTGKWRTDWAGRFGKTQLRQVEKGKKRILFHAVSLGEVNAIRHLVAVFEAQVPEVELVIAATTNTGYDRAVMLYQGRSNVVGVVRYPLDFSCAVGRFLDVVEPDVAVMVELELWPNFAEACERREVPLAVVNGRLSERSFGRYKVARPLVVSTFGRVSAAGVQTQAYADRFIAMGTAADRVHVLDTMKWDTAVVSQSVEGADELAASLGLDRTRPIVVAGSTGPGEEAVIVEAVRRCGVEGVQIVLVPRKPERFDEVAGLFAGCVRRTYVVGEGVLEHARVDEASPRSNRDVFLVDTMGELRKAYALADVVVVGRSLVKMGGSDPIEPGGLGKAVIVGPYMDNFADVVEAFTSAGAMLRLADSDAGTLGEAVEGLLRDRERSGKLGEAARQVILERRGSTQRHVDMLLDLLG